MMGTPAFSRRRIEETARTQDVLNRARAANPVTAGSDRLNSLKSFIDRGKL